MRSSELRGYQKKKKTSWGSMFWSLSLSEAVDDRLKQQHVPLKGNIPLWFCYLIVWYIKSFSRKMETCLNLNNHLFMYWLPWPKKHCVLWYQRTQSSIFKGQKSYKYAWLNSCSRDYPVLSIFGHQAYKDCLSFPQSIVQDLSFYTDLSLQSIFFTHCTCIYS